MKALSKFGTTRRNFSDAYVYNRRSTFESSFSASLSMSSASVNGGEPLQLVVGMASVDDPHSHENLKVDGKTRQVETKARK